MDREVTPQQRKLIRSCIVAPMLVTIGYHDVRLYQVLPAISLLFMLAGAAIALLSLWTVERKYEYKVPSMTDLWSYGIAFLLIGGVNFSVVYNVHNQDKFHEALSSLLSLLCILPFMLFVGQKKSIPSSRASQI